MVARAHKPSTIMAESACARRAPTIVDAVAFIIVVIGASLGGMDAMRIILNSLPARFPLPIAVVQHRESSGGDLLEESLRNASELPVVGIVDKQVIMPGRVHVAPGGYHALVDDECFALSTEERSRFSRPSIDVLFTSAAQFYGDGVIGVILSGANDDGARGLATIASCGGLAIVQDPDSAAARAMPDAALAAVPDARVLPLDAIGAALWYAATKRESRFAARRYRPGTWRD